MQFSARATPNATRNRCWKRREARVCSGRENAAFSFQLLAFSYESKAKTKR